MVEKQIQTSIADNSPQRLSKGVSARNSPQATQVTRIIDYSPKFSPVHLSYIPEPVRTVIPIPSNFIPIKSSENFEPLVLIKNPKENIQVVTGLEKVIEDNPDAYNPKEGKENHELKQLRNVKIADPELKKKKGYVFKSKLRPGDYGIQCPIEDPRNPYHADYLKLKAAADGHLKEESLQQNNIFRVPELKRSNHQGRRKIWDSDETGLDSSKGKTTPYNSINTSSKLSGRPMSSVPLPEVHRNPPTDGIVDNYHYCEDCDVAFKKAKHCGDAIVTGYLPDGSLGVTFPLVQSGTQVVSSPSRVVYGHE